MNGQSNIFENVMVHEFLLDLNKNLADSEEEQIMETNTNKCHIS